MYFRQPVWGMVNLAGPSYIPPPTGGLNAATQAWIDAVVADGGAVSTRQSGYVDDLVNLLLPFGLWWGVADGLWLIGGESDPHQAKINLVNPTGTQASFIGTSTLKQRGFYGDWSTGVFDTNFNPSVGTPNMTATSQSFGYFVAPEWEASSTYGAEASRAGASDGVSYNVLRMYQHSGPYFNVYWNTTVTLHQPPVPFDRKRAFWLITRDPADPGYVSMYCSGVLQERWADSDPGIPNMSFSVSGEHAGASTYTGFDRDPYSAVWVGGGLNPTQVANLTTCLEGYLNKHHINTVINGIKGSEDFSNTAQWSPGANAVLAQDLMVAAPDGNVGATNTVCKYFMLVGGPYSFSQFIGPNSSGSILAGANTLSIYVKPNFWQYFAMRMYDGTSREVWYDLTAGTVETETGGAVGTIEALDDGWFRCILTATATASGSSAMWLADADASYDATGVSSNGVWLWGAQMVTGSLPLSYSYVEAL